MFRQLLVLSCFIALAIASDEVWFELGYRQEGDQNLFNQTTRSFETEEPTRHSINLLFNAGENTLTHARFDVEGDNFDEFYMYALDNGFNVTVIAFNTTQLAAQATIYGFLPGEAPVDFVAENMVSKKFIRN